MQTAEGDKGTGRGRGVYSSLEKYTPLSKTRLLTNVEWVPDNFSRKAPLKVLCCRLQRGGLGTGRGWLLIELDAVPY